MINLRELSPAERGDWLRLIRTQNIGPITFYQLVQRFGSAGDALRHAPAYARASGRKRQFTLAKNDMIEAELDAGARFGAQLVCACEPSYPAPLRHIPDAPPILWVKGSPGLFDKSIIAIVGARNASSVGRHMAQQLASELGAAGIVIASGLARGIDGAAHQASLATGTIAVVAGGIDIVYPPEHTALTAEIAERGTLIAESPMGYQPQGRDFPKRNRIISGLSMGVVVVEAAARSGTLITARLAAEQGREVFAVPGSPLDPRCAGTNQLLRDGASLVTKADDILEFLQGMGKRFTEPEQMALLDNAPADFSEKDRKKIAQAITMALSFTPIHRDILLREINAPAPLIMDALLDLVLTGIAEEQGGGHFCLAPNLSL